MLEECYASAKIDRVPFGHDLELVYSDVSGSIQLLPTSLIAILVACPNFATIDDHALRLYKATESSQQTFESIRHQLKNLVENRLLIGQNDMLCRIERPDSFLGNQPRIGTVGILTKNRPNALKRALTSYVENCVDHGRNNDFVIVDDSDQGAFEEQNREVLVSLKRRYGATILYANRNDCTRFATDLIHHGGLRSEIVKFALLDQKSGARSVGASWNSLLLHTVGDMYLCLGEETVCELTSSPSVEDTLEYTHGFDPTELWFYRGGRIPLEMEGSSRRDMLGAHERLLGRQVRDCLAESLQRNQLKLGRETGGELRKLHRGTTILGTTGTYFGNPGIASPLQYFFLEGDSLDRLLQDEAEYRLALTNCKALRAPRGAAICTDTFLVGGNMGLDNRNLLPPFLSADTGADSIFAHCLNAGFESPVGFLPFALRHDPLEESPHTMEEVWKEAKSVRMEEIFRLLIAAWLSSLFPAGIATCRERLSDLGRYCLGIASMPLPEFSKFTRKQSIYLAAAKLEQIYKHIQNSGDRPKYWVRDLMSYFQILRDASVDPNYAVPRELLGEDVDNFEPITRLRDLIALFGRLLEIWPEVVDCAKEMRFRGQRVAKAL